MGSPGIDTTSLLTIFGVIAAVWAIVPPTSRLSFRLSLSWFTERFKDELFEAILRTLGRIEAVPRLAPLANAMANSLVRPHGFKASDGYVQGSLFTSLEK
ncbi:hypothetical protein [Roseateles koreensis]|uniref:Uncharacterized protein n=1 Tax=Roseateles koreensis TaxID=2987526 RepID=A0ABT5KTE0_9BURK|nr:hypothetical protein [Roseateles koreensis]MDC8785695.1 hypothetical protein [Roseateles koreensis]